MTRFTPHNLQRALATIGAELSAELFPALENAYTAPHRHYHTTAHIDDCLQQLEQVRDLAQHPAEIEVALWFHDAIYDPRRTDNEEESAAWLRDYLRFQRTAPEQIERMAGLIMTTRFHEPHTPDSQVMVDVDLRILGASDADFEAYDAAIRREYDWVPEDQYRAGRVRVLRAFLQRPVIFHTPFFRERYEEQARRNLRRKIGELAED